MKSAAFEELITSVRQAGAIRRGRLKPARNTKLKRADEDADDLAALRNRVKERTVALEDFVRGLKRRRKL